MFDVGGGEILLVLVLALVVLGPERLPEVARTVGRWTGRAKAMFNNLRYELEREAYNKDLQEKFDAQMRQMGIDPESLKKPGGTPTRLRDDSPAHHTDDLIGQADVIGSNLDKPTATDNPAGLNQPGNNNDNNDHKRP